MNGVPEALAAFGAEPSTFNRVIDEFYGDPCDNWDVFMWNGRLCRMNQYDSGVSPGPGDPWCTSWQYEVAETSFIPYGVFRCFQAVPIDHWWETEQAHLEFLQKQRHLSQMYDAFDAIFPEDKA